MQFIPAHYILDNTVYYNFENNLFEDDLLV